MYCEIYKIIDNTNGNIYIGSTSTNIQHRLESHIKKYKEYLKYKKRYYNSFDILKNNDYKIVLIENCVCNSKKELLIKEQHYIDNINCINKKRAYTSEYSKKQNDKKYRDYIKSWSSIYNDNNLLKINVNLFL